MLPVLQRLGDAYGFLLSLLLLKFLTGIILASFSISSITSALTGVIKPIPSNKHNRSSGDCLEGKRENYQVCSVQYCVQQLYTVNCEHIWTELTVLWIGFCLTGTISLCLDSFLWPPSVIGHAIIFLPCGFYLLSIFPLLISVVGDSMSAILPRMMWP